MKHDDPAQPYSTLDVSSRDAVLTVTLRRPDARNALNLQMCRDLIDLFSSLRFGSHSGEPPRVVLLQGSGLAFCAGIDVKEMAAQKPDWIRQRRSLGLDTYLAIERAPIPVIALVHGASIGAGCELMASCDFAIAATGSSFRWPEAALGAVGATQRLPRIVGSAMARELLFTARRIDVDEALRLHLVNRVVDAADLYSCGLGVAAEICKSVPATVALIKRSMVLGQELPLPSAIEIERQIIVQSI